MAERKAGQAVATRTSTDVAVARPAGLPRNLAPNTVRIPRIKKAEPLSAPVRNGVAGFLDIYSETGRDDSDPQVLVKADPKTGSKPGEALRFHVLAIESGRSESVGDELISYTLQGGRWIDRDGNEAGPDSYDTQTYTVCIPEVDPTTPYKVMFYRSSMPAASNVNTALVKAEEQGLADWQLAFELTTELRKSDKYTWGVFIAKQVPAVDEHVVAATELAEKVAVFLSSQPAPAIPVERPEI